MKLEGRNISIICSIILVWMVAAGEVFAQKARKYELTFFAPAEAPGFVEEYVEYKKLQPDSLSSVYEVQKVVTQLRAAAFLEASADSIHFRDSLVFVFLHAGPQYEWARLSDGNIGELVLGQVGFREKNFHEELVSTRDVAELIEDLLTFSENHGFPFAKVWLDSLQTENGVLSAKLFMDRKSLIKLAKPQVKGNVNISEQYLSFYLGLKEGDPYNREKILQIKNRLQELPFLKLKKDPFVSFNNGFATIHLELEKKNASRFDFLIGVLPNNKVTGKVLITGALEAEFHNQFGKAEQLYLKFEQLRPQTQQVEVDFSYPYLLKLPFGIDFNFELYRRDTNFIDIKYEGGIKYHFQGNNYLKAFAGNHISNLLTVDTSRIAITGKLPDTLDVNRTTFGLEYAFEKLDYRFNPRKGFSARLRGGAGIREVRRNNQIEQAGLGELYDELDERSFQYRVNAGVAWYFPIAQTGVVKAGVQAGMILSNEKILANEQYRIGGNRLLRGFDEESVFATNYAVSTLEYRLLLDRNSFIYLFGDLARVDTETSQSEQETVIYPYGFGAGITFETRAGIFGVSLAYGAQSGIPIDFGQPKVHFGFVSLF